MNTIILMIKGMIIGVANIIPGVSGGTMAFILGIYQQLSEAIGYFLIRPEKRKEYLLFLTKIIIGVVIGFLLFAKLISFLLGVDLPEGTPLPFSYVPTFGFFLGLILGSIPVLIKLQQDTRVSLLRIGLSIMGFIALFAISSLKESTNNIATTTTLINDFGFFKIELPHVGRIIWLGIVGMLAAATMIIPGISGSALLVALGEYGNILHYIDERSIVPLGIIGGGAIIGLITTTLIIAKLLENKAGGTFYVIMGLVLASCAQVIIQMTTAGASVLAWIVAVPTTILGIVLALQSEKLNPKK
ncbi:MAG: DUF368 domain-containing protein [Brevinema sp.]